MQLSKRVQALHAEYARLALAGERSLNLDQARSLDFYRAELAFVANPQTFVASRNQIVVWVRMVYQVEYFVAEAGRLPHQNSRLPQVDIDREEWALTDWLRYRQGRAVDTGRLCDYQMRRLACIPGYRQHPRQAAWDARLDEYRLFIRAHRRAPRYRNADEAEKSLARWVVLQRGAYRAGTMPEHRIRALSELDFWVWGKKKAPAGSGSAGRPRLDEERS